MVHVSALVNMTDDTNVSARPVRAQYPCAVLDLGGQVSIYLTTERQADNIIMAAMDALRALRVTAKAIEQAAAESVPASSPAEQAMSDAEDAMAAADAVKVSGSREWPYR